ncbi:MAG: HDOD domain-containing protein [Nitrospirae bacterium]|nr:MAG: HDOD domain-containing protein [Nitrospirota bacterium]
MIRNEKLEDIILKTVDVPSIPAIAAKVLKITNDDRASIAELEKIISKDEAFAARVLKVANSPYFGRSRDICSISTAMMVIGFNNMHSLVVASALKDLYKKNTVYEKSLWEHSLCVSIAAAILACETRLVPTEEAHIAALVHDLGASVLLNCMPNDYKAITDKAYRDGISLIKAEEEFLRFNHCDTGNLIARKWRLPMSMELVMSYHHKETIDAIPKSTEELDLNICRVVKAADELCLNIGIGLKNPDTSARLDLGDIGIPESRIPEIKKEIEKNYLEHTSDIIL